MVSIFQISYPLALTELLEVIFSLNLIGLCVEPGLGVLELSLNIRQVFGHDLDAILVVLQRHIGVLKLLPAALDVRIELPIVLIREGW